MFMVGVNFANRQEAEHFSAVVEQKIAGMAMLHVYSMYIHNYINNYYNNYTYHEVHAIAPHTSNLQILE